MKAVIISRMVVSLITSIIFSIIASIIVMNTSYGFISYFIAFLIYGTPPILIIGLPYSLLIEVLLTRFKIKNKLLHLIRLIFLYAGGGFAGALLYIYILAAGDPRKYKDLLPLSIFGVLAALLYLIIIYSFNKLSRVLSSARK